MDRDLERQPPLYYQMHQKTCSLMEKTAVVNSSNGSLQDKNLGRKWLCSVPMDAAPGQNYSSGNDLQNWPKPPVMGLEVCSAQPPSQLSSGAPPMLLLVGLSTLLSGHSCFPLS